jgi:hypothetical protein
MAAEEKAPPKPVDPRTVELGGTLAGYSFVYDRDLVTVGVIEDLESMSVTRWVQALLAIIVSGNLPHGIDHDGFKALKVDQLGDVALALRESFAAPKAS